MRTLDLEQTTTGTACGCKQCRRNSDDNHGNVAGHDGADVLQRILEAPAAFARRQPALGGFEVIARPGDPLLSPLQGDVLIRIIEGGGGHAAVVASPGLWRAGELADQGLIADSEYAEGYLHVTEHSPVARHASEGWARGATDRGGRLLEDLLLLRLVTPQSPTVVTVAPPAAPAPPPATTDEPIAAQEVPQGDSQGEPGEDEVSCDHIDAAQLSWPAASSAQQDLMRRVYLRQVTAACQGRHFVGDVAASELMEIERGVRARRAAAESCRALLLSARSAMASDSSAADVASIGVLSGYRSASTQLSSWNSNFSRYYTETQADRTAAEGGEFSNAAAGLLTRYISRRLAAPGFSLHNDGRAIDFSTTQGGKSMGADTSARSRSNWRASWFFGWLVANANGFGFFQNTSIDEPWHWEFRGQAAPATQSLEDFEISSAGMAPDTVEPTEGGEPERSESQRSGSQRYWSAAETTIAAGRLELSNTPALAAHRGTQPDLILRWNDMTDPTGVDVVLHLHGYGNRGDRERMSLLGKERYSGLDFSHPGNSTDPRPGRSVPTLCILPRGSYAGDTPRANPEKYTFPALFSRIAIPELISYSLGQFQASTGPTSSLSPRRFILTAHSGGGEALMRVLAHTAPDEIQVFDALYWDVSPLIAWIASRITAEIQSWTAGKTHADGGLCILYRVGGTKVQSVRVKDAIRAAIASGPPDARAVLHAAYRVLSTSVDHGEIPRRFGWQLLADIAAPLSTESPSSEGEGADPQIGRSESMVWLRPALEAAGGEGAFAEELGPEEKFTDTFAVVEHLDQDAPELASGRKAWEWAKVSHFEESLSSPGGTFDEIERLDSSAFSSISLTELKALGLIRDVARPAAGQANYEFKNKFRIYYPRGAASRQVAGKRALPVVVVVHGNHGWSKGGVEIDNHLGYGYLQEELAKRGIISISISTNQANILGSLIRTRAEFILSALQILKTLNSSRTLFQNRLDLQNIGLVGHSRGGNAVVKAAILNRGSAVFGIQAVCSLAPTDDTGDARVADRLKLEDKDGLRYLVLYGSHDGDVFPGDGFRHYDRATCDRSMAFVKGMKHDRFNSNWKDWVNYTDPYDCAASDPDYLTESDHHQLAIEYIGGLFRLELNNERSLQGLFDGSIAPTGVHTVCLQWSPPQTPRTLATVWGTPLNKSDHWTRGWTTLMPFQLPGSDAPFEFAYKNQTGEVAIDKIHTDGSGTDMIWKSQWRPGWTNFLPFRLPGDDRTWYLAYKTGTGEACIDRILRDGKGVDVRMWQGKWTAGWTTFLPFSLPGDDRPYYLAYKVATGEVSIDRIWRDGKGVDIRIWQDKWTVGWTSFVPFQLPGDDRPHYLAYKSATGEVSIDRIWRDGKGVDIRVWRDKWATGWTTFAPFRMPGDDRPHYVAYKRENGEIAIDRIRRNGQGIDTLWKDRWTKGWSNFMPFELGGKPHIQVYKEDAGDVAIVRIFPDRMQEIDSFEGADTTRNSMGGAASLSAAKRVLFQAGAGAFSMSIPHQTTVLQCNAAGAKYSAEVPAANKNFEGFDLLTLRLASDFKLDSAADIAADSFPEFKVRVIYGAGMTTANAEVTQAQLDISGVRSRQRPFLRMVCDGPVHQLASGELVKVPPITSANITKIVLQTLAIPLNKFKGVNWHEVRAIEFEAGPSVPRPLYLDSLAVVQS